MASIDYFSFFFQIGTYLSVHECIRDIQVTANHPKTKSSCLLSMLALAKDFVNLVFDNQIFRLILQVLIVIWRLLVSARARKILSVVAFCNYHHYFHIKLFLFIFGGAICTNRNSGNLPFIQSWFTFHRWISVRLRLFTNMHINRSVRRIRPKRKQLWW